MNIYAASDIGLMRQTNQDCYDFEVINCELSWALVCDGMGGAGKFGDLASQIAKDAVKERLHTYFSKITAEDTENLNDDAIKNELINCLNCANEKIFNESLTKKDNMGTTIVLAVVYKNSLHVVHVGDSRAYLINEKAVKQVTRDHSVVEELVKSGKITTEEAKKFPQKNVITRALGIEEDIDVEYNRISLKENDNIILCTDGLSNYVENEELLSYFRKHKGNEFVGELIKHANDLGGRDNITVLLISRLQNY